MPYFSVVNSLLRERQEFLQEIRNQIKLPQKILSLLISSFAFFAIYGFIIGANGSLLQSILSAIKLPTLYLLTLIVCFPTLYFFNAMFGAKRTFGQYLALLMTSMTFISILQLGFAPISLFFLLSTTDLIFFKFLNISIFTLTGFLGVKFFAEEMRIISELDQDGKDIRRNILNLWLVLYAFVGTQLAWTLRPFFGDGPGAPFELFRARGGNFYLDVLQTIQLMLGIK